MSAEFYKKYKGAIEAIADAGKTLLEAIPESDGGYQDSPMVPRQSHATHAMHTAHQVWSQMFGEESGLARAHLRHSQQEAMLDKQSAYLEKQDAATGKAGVGLVHLSPDLQQAIMQQIGEHAYNCPAGLHADPDDDDEELLLAALASHEDAILRLRIRLNHSLTAEEEALAAERGWISRHPGDAGPSDAG